MPAMADAPLRWLGCRLVAGHGVASGRATTSPYPAGTIQLQAPFFAARGLDVSPFFAGTLNLEAARGQWRLRDPDQRIEALEWTDRHPPETFSFWHCRLRLARAATSEAAGCGERPGLGSQPADGPQPRAGAGSTGERQVASEGMARALGDGRGLLEPAGIPALIYHPHPETKRAHHQSPGCLEVLAPWIAGLRPGMELELGVDPRRCRLIDPARLRARLLEFLKFRVLAAQEEFFLAFEAPRAGTAVTGSPEASADPADPINPAAAHAAALATHPKPAEAGGTASPSGKPSCGITAGDAPDADRFRLWLRGLWPEALDLDDQDLLETLEQARMLYVN